MEVFGNLSERLQGTLRNLQGQGKLTEDNIKEALREVKMALLEADVNMKIVKSFVNSIRDQVLGNDVDANLDPGKQFIKLVHEKLVEVMGKVPEDLAIDNGRLNKILMVGLQGSGKTTTTGKLAKRYAKHNPLLVACDIYRPAAIQQLETVATQVNAGFYEQGVDKDPVEIANSEMKTITKLFNTSLNSICFCGLPSFF